MKIGQTEVPNNVLIIAVVILAVIFLGVYVAWPKPVPKIDTQKIINDTKAEMTKQYDGQLKTKDALIKEKDVQIKDYRARLTIAEGRYSDLKKKYDDLERERLNVQPPKTDKELRDRFLLLILFLPPLASAESDTSASPPAIASDILVKLEQAKYAEQQLAVAAEKDANLRQQADILRGTIKLYEEQIAAYKDQGVIFKNMIDMQNKMSDMKDKACDERVKAATPTFWDNMTKYIVGAAGGAGALGILLLVL
jgi:hypothetical protein